MNRQWWVHVEGYAPFLMIGPTTLVEAIETARGIWPQAEVTQP